MSKLHLLIIRGLRPADFGRVTIAPQPAQPASLPTASQQYKPIPPRFTTVAAWPRTSDLRCWMCDQLSSSYPCFIPMHYAEIDGVPTCDTYGNFDKWGCVMRFINREYPASERWDLHRAVSKIESLFTGAEPRKKIPEALPKYLMSQYCGDGGLTLQQWRDASQRNDVEYSRVPGCLAL